MIGILQYVIQTFLSVFTVVKGMKTSQIFYADLDHVFIIQFN